MIVPAQQDAALLADIHTPAAAPGVLSLWWLGQSGFLVKAGRDFALLDPYLSDSLTRKYAGTLRPHVRMTTRCLDPATLGFVDLVLCSHGHTDHFDPETLQAIATAPGRAARLRVVLPAAHLARAEQLLARLDVECLGLTAHACRSAGAFLIEATPAAHPTIEYDSDGRDLFLGFVLRTGTHSLYHSGDTVWHERVVAAAAAARPRIALLPINGHRPERGVAGNLDAEEAARLARMIGAHIAIPHHYEMFEFNTGCPGDFLRACASVGLSSRALRCGERMDIGPFSSDGALRDPQ